MSAMSQQLKGASKLDPLITITGTNKQTTTADDLQIEVQWHPRTQLAAVKLDDVR